jgi:hypothetical protein
MSTTHTVAPTPQPAADESMASRKGEVTLCHACNNAKLPPPKRLHCRFCLSNGYIAKCLPCQGSGIVVATAVWDGKSKHGSTCLTCGGLGCIPARESEFKT